MKNFFIKLIAILFGIIFLLNYVYNSFLRENITKFEKILSLNERDNRMELRNKIRSELKNASQKDKLFAEEDKIILYDLYKKIKNEFKEISESNK
jgi:hypothetical protein